MCLECFCIEKVKPKKERSVRWKTFEQKKDKEILYLQPSLDNMADKYSSSYSSVGSEYSSEYRSELSREDEESRLLTLPDDGMSRFSFRDDELSESYSVNEWNSRGGIYETTTSQMR